MSKTTQLKAWARTLFVAHAALGMALVSISCVDTSSGLDPDKPLPGDLPTSGQPPPTCGLDNLTGEMPLRMHVIDVGQGDAILITTPDDGVDGNGTAEGLNILIDAGNLGTGELTDGGEVVVDYLDRLGIETIDYAIISHAHADHYGGMVDVFKEKNVINVVDPGYQSDNTSWGRFITEASAETQANGGRHFRPAIGEWVESRGNTVDMGSELQVEVLHAMDAATLGEAENTQINNTSIVLRFTYGGASILLMGDAEEEVERMLLGENANVKANILKVGHHGSSTSSTSEFVAAVFGDAPEQDRYAVISSGRVSFSGTQLPTLGTKERIGRLVESTQFFSTERGDGDKTEEDAARDDDVVFVITSAGEIKACYLF